MSSAQLNAGEAHGQTQAKTEQWVESAQNTANMASDKMADSADSAQNIANKASDKMADSAESAQQGKEQSAGIIQQTGEQVMHMAQGAIDGVKNTLGMNEKK